MEFIRELYIGEKVQSLGVVLYALKRNIAAEGIYCICFCEGGSSFLEILSSRELVKERCQKRKYTVLGLALGRREAYDLLRYILQDLEDHHVALENIRQYLNMTGVDGS